MDFKELKFLLKHSSVYGLGSIIGQAISFLLLPLYTKYLTPADYGVMALVDIARGTIGLVLSLGIINGLSRFYYEYSDDQQRRLAISSAYWVVFAVIILFSPFAWYLAPVLSTLLFHSSDYSTIFFVSLLSLLFGLLVDLGIDYLRIRAESVKFVKITLLRVICLISCNIYFVVFLKTGVIGIFYASLLVSIIFAIFLTIFVLMKTKIGFSRQHAKEMIYYSFPLIFSNLFRVIVNESDKLFINFFFSPFETGIYSIAQKVGTSIHVLITSSFLQAYLPRRFQIMKEKNATQEYANIFDYYLLAICTSGLILAVFSHEIILLMTTTEYYRAAVYIPFIIISMVVFGMKYHFEIGIVISKKTKYIAYIDGSSCAVNVLLNWLLIKKFGIAGAILSVNLSYLATTVLNLLVTQRLYPVQFHYAKLFGLLGLCSSIYLVSIFATLDSLLGSILLKSFLCIIYFILLYRTGLLSHELVATVKAKLMARRVVEPVVKDM